MNAIRQPLHVAIVGGGFTGASLAWQLARMRLAVRLTVIEPRPDLGRGLAYSASDPVHRLNVPAHRMSIDPGNCADFSDWLTENPGAADAGAVAANGDIYVQRALFGRYVAERLAPHLASGAVRHVRARVVDVRRGDGGRLWLKLSEGREIRADLLVLATGHPAPALPGPVAGLAGSDALITDPDQLATVPGDARVLILGSGLSAADAIATLDRQGHGGPVICLSRRGLRPRSQGNFSRGSRADFTDPPSRRVSDLLRRVRHAIVDDRAQGLGWQATFWQLRAQAPQIWAALDLDAQRRFLRHLRVWWDVHRYRLAPQTQAALDRLAAEGRLDFTAGRLVSAHLQGGRIEAHWRPRGQRQVRLGYFDRLILTTGPAQDRCIAANPALRALARLELIAPCPLGLGLAVTDTCKALDARGRESDRILVAGPLARGHLGELTGAPECASQSQEVARQIARHAMLATILRPAPLDAGRTTQPS